METPELRAQLYIKEHSLPVGPESLSAAPFRGSKALVVRAAGLLWGE